MRPKLFLPIYLGVVCSTSLFWLIFIFIKIVPNTLINGESYYKNFGGRLRAEIQDQDLFLNNIDHVIDEVKEADIVILGPSFSSFAFDQSILNRFQEKYHIKIFNMSFIGIRGGEFSRILINKWSLRPKLWVINTDSQFTPFFSDSVELTLAGPGQPIAPLSYGFLTSYIGVRLRALRWHYQDLRFNNSSQYTYLYRGVRNGDVTPLNENFYKINPGIKFTNLNNCGATEAQTKKQISYAKKFITDADGEVVLTLVPHSEACLTQANELSHRLNVPLITPVFDGFTSWDNGGHLDKNGAVRFTEEFLSLLESSDSFQRAILRH